MKWEFYNGEYTYDQLDTIITTPSVNSFFPEW